MGIGMDIAKFRVSYRGEGFHQYETSLKIAQIHSEGVEPKVGLIEVYEPLITKVSKTSPPQMRKIKKIS